MRAVRRHPLKQHAGGQLVQLPIGTQIIGAGIDTAEVYLWILSRSDALTETRRIWVCATLDSIPDDLPLVRIATVENVTTTLHVFEVLS